MEPTSAPANQSVSPPDPTSDNIQFATSVLAFYITGILSVFGIIGNVLSVVVLQRANRHRRCPLFTILSALCMVDAVFILGNFVMNVLTVFYEYYQMPSLVVYYFYLNRGGMVKYLVPVCFTMQLASIYITLLVSFERFQAVCRPLSVANGKPAGRAVYRNLGLVLLLSAAYNVPKFFEINVNDIPIGSDVATDWKKQRLVENSRRLFGCQLARPLPGNESECEIMVAGNYPAEWMQRPGNGSATGLYELVYSGVLYTTFYFVVPVTAITFMNIRIAKSLRRSINMWQVTRRQEKEAQLTYVSLAIVVSFYLFMLPNVLLTIIETVVRPSEQHQQRMQLVIVATNFLVLINSCLNFILYCVIGKKFRQSLRDLLCWPCDRWGRRQRRHSQAASTEAPLKPKSAGAPRTSRRSSQQQEQQQQRQRPQQRECSSCAADNEDSEAADSARAADIELRPLRRPGSAAAASSAGERDGSAEFD